MRVPRNLLPFVLPENINKLFLSTFAHSNDEMDIKSDTSMPSNWNDEMDIKSVTDISSRTNDEMEVADCLIDTLMDEVWMDEIGWRRERIIVFVVLLRDKEAFTKRACESKEFRCFSCWYT